MEPLARGDPKRIGEYRLLGCLGEGGMGKVYIARTQAHPIAIKVIHGTITGDPAFRDRFDREVRLAQQVRGPYTAAVIDADPHASRPWMAIEYVPGVPLSEAVKAAGPLPKASLRILIVGLAEALRAIHHAGIIHRDLKPSNVLLTNNAPRVIDFGIAKAMENTEKTLFMPLTPIGETIGSPGYMSPEQIRGQDLTPKSDVFSLGSTFYYAATGCHPFGAGHDSVVYSRTLEQEPDFDTVPAFRALIAECLKKTPDRRPTLKQVMERLGPVSIADTAS